MSTKISGSKYAAKSIAFIGKAGRDQEIGKLVCQ